MSLTGFLSLPEVAAKVKPLRPKLSRKVGVPLMSIPRTSHYSLVGTAFDYFVRFEIQRRAPWAVCRPWTAECVPDVFWSRSSLSDSQVSVEMSQLDDRRLQRLASRKYGDPIAIAEDAASRARQVVEQARAVIDAFLTKKTVAPAALKEAARHALRLAKLDPVYRAGRLVPDMFEEPDPADVQDLLDLLAIVPFDLLLHDHVLLVNPSFPKSSPLVGGADADLLTGDTLVDFKTTKKDEMEGCHLDQILGYLLLARNERRLNQDFPAVNRLAFYFSRHGHLWALPTSVWTDLPEFPDVEAWLIQHAGEVYALPAKKTVAGKREDVQAGRQLRRKKPR